MWQKFRVYLVSKRKNGQDVRTTRLLGLEDIYRFFVGQIA